MKFIQSISVGFALVGTLLFSACGDQGNQSTNGETPQGKEYTSEYICPMHCEGSGSDKPGTCPVCGMDYEKNENHNHSH